jgi:hypothetical protein
MGKRGFGLADGILLASTERLPLGYPCDVSSSLRNFKVMHGSLTRLEPNTTLGREKKTISFLISITEGGLIKYNP